MDEREEVIRKIVEVEWEMFSQVRSLTPDPSCQSDRPGFEVMRRSQFAPWPLDLLSRYLAFAAEAKDSGRNIITEKYAYMMKSTYPEEYAAMESQLPAVSPEAEELVEACVRLHITWKKELDAKYPAIEVFGRARESTEDTKDSTSVETYLRGELMTYPLELLEAYRQFLHEIEEQGRNYPELVLAETARSMGFPGLEAMERYARGKLGRT